MNVTITPKQHILDAMPRQNGTVVEREDVLELQRLADGLSQQVERRERRRAGDAATMAATFLPARARRRVLRTVLLWVGYAVAAAVVAMLALSLFASSKPQAPAPHVPIPQPAVALTPAQAMGQAAAERLSSGGRPTDVFVCQGAYEADAATSPTVLPSPGTVSPVHDEYMSACMSDMSSR